MRIVRVANFVSAESGGLRTALHGLGRGYVTAGHEASLIVPGDEYSDVMTDQGRVITLPGMPAAGNRRMLVRRAPVIRILEELDPERLEVSDRSTLRWIGPWARRRGIPTMMISHESLTGRLETLPVFSRAAAAFGDYANKRSAQDFDQIVCCSGWAASEFERLAVDNLLRIPLGVDLETFSPERRSLELRDRYAARGEMLIVYAGRLAPEKEPERVLDALESLRAGGLPAVLVVAGSGVMQERMEKRAAATGLPVTLPRLRARPPTTSRRCWPRRTWRWPRPPRNLLPLRTRSPGVRNPGRRQHARRGQRDRRRGRSRRRGRGLRRGSQSAARTARGRAPRAGQSPRRALRLVHVGRRIPRSPPRQPGDARRARQAAPTQAPCK